MVFQLLGTSHASQICFPAANYVNFGQGCMSLSPRKRPKSRRQRANAVFRKCPHISLSIYFTILSLGVLFEWIWGSRCATFGFQSSKIGLPKCHLCDVNALIPQESNFQSQRSNLTMSICCPPRMRRSRVSDLNPPHPSGCLGVWDYFCCSLTPRG